jgi:hypothetical protein
LTKVTALLVVSLLGSFLPVAKRWLEARLRIAEHSEPRLQEHVKRAMAIARPRLRKIIEAFRQSAGH